MSVRTTSCKIATKVCNLLVASDNLHYY